MDRAAAGGRGGLGPLEEGCVGVSFGVASH